MILRERNEGKRGRKKEIKKEWKKESKEECMERRKYEKKKGGKKRRRKIREESMVVTVGVLMKNVRTRKEGSKGIENKGKMMKAGREEYIVIIRCKDYINLDYVNG